MIVVDANVLIYAVDENSAHHRVAKRWMESVLSSNETIGLPWIALLAFLRLTTKSGFFRQPLTIEGAFKIVQAWLDHPSVSIIEPGPRHVQVLRTLLLKTGTAGNLTTDAHLAALVMEHGAELYSFDHDFVRFPGLQWSEPEY